MIYKAILVIQSVNIILNINEMYTNPLFVQCPHVTNMTNVMELGHYQYEGNTVIRWSHISNVSLLYLL